MSFGVDVLGDLILARWWNFGTDDGQVGRVQLLKGLCCHSSETAVSLQPSESSGRIVRKGPSRV